MTPATQYRQMTATELDFVVLFMDTQNLRGAEFAPNSLRVQDESGRELRICCLGAAFGFQAQGYQSKMIVR